MSYPNPGKPTTWKWLTLHDHQVEPPGRRPPRRPLLYFAFTLLAIAGFFALLYLIDVLGWFGK